MGAVLPLHAPVVDQPHVGLVDQRGGLEAMAGSLAFHVAMRQAAELGVHDRGQLGECLLIAVAPRTEERTDVIPNGLTSAPAWLHCEARQIVSGLLLFFA
jgi:hypothetical protein